MGAVREFRDTVESLGEKGLLGDGAGSSCGVFDWETVPRFCCSFLLPSALSLLQKSLPQNGKGGLVLLRTQFFFHFDQLFKGQDPEPRFADLDFIGMFQQVRVALPGSYGSEKVEGAKAGHKELMTGRRQVILFRLQPLVLSASIVGVQFFQSRQ